MIVITSQSAKGESLAKFRRYDAEDRCGIGNGFLELGCGWFYEGFYVCLPGRVCVFTSIYLGHIKGMYWFCGDMMGDR